MMLLAHAKARTGSTQKPRGSRDGVGHASSSMGLGSGKVRRDPVDLIRLLAILLGGRGLARGGP
eukprot:6176600-Pyramimonas_sp.AAC.1